VLLGKRLLPRELMALKAVLAVGAGTGLGILLAYLLQPRPESLTCTGAETDVGPDGPCPDGSVQVPGSPGCCYGCPAGDVVEINGVCPNCYGPDPSNPGCCAPSPCSSACPNGPCPAGETCTDGSCSCACSDDCPDGTCPSGSSCCCAPGYGCVCCDTGGTECCNQGGPIGCNPCEGG
jgi:hypothetical protein